MDVPQDGPAYLHQGEMVIPRTFAQDLRESLNGSSKPSNTSAPIMVNIYNTGSVISERDLVKTVYTGIKTMRSQGQI